MTVDSVLLLRSFSNMMRNWAPAVLLPMEFIFDCSSAEYRHLLSKHDVTRLDSGVELDWVGFKDYKTKGFWALLFLQK